MEKLVPDARKIGSASEKRVSIQKTVVPMPEKMVSGSEKIVSTTETCVSTTETCVSMTETCVSMTKTTRFDDENNRFDDENNGFDDGNNCFDDENNYFDDGNTVSFRQGCVGLRFCEFPPGRSPCRGERPPGAGGYLRLEDQQSGWNAWIAQCGFNRVLTDLPGYVPGSRCSSRASSPWDCGKHLRHASAVASGSRRDRLPQAHRCV